MKNIKQIKTEAEILEAWVNLAAFLSGKPVSYFSHFTPRDLRQWLGFCQHCHGGPAGDDE